MTVPLASPSSPAADPHRPLVSDHDLLTRVEVLVPVAVRRQLWTLFLDSDDVQLPMVVPLEGIPERPDRSAVERWGDALDAVSAEFGVASVVFVLERPGPRVDTDPDCAWRLALAHLAESRRFAVRAVFTCASDGVVLPSAARSAPVPDDERCSRPQPSPRRLRLSEELTVR
ncbi:hypothetical protein ES689_04960 [Frigoribacterium sp. ACAM 257]|uniref:hypothetical protein n=1 Tax=Frigoribacterium sp. ACAM 257 TaxID=2508998 RepID=UPI0011B9E532|nr:hypothetical protein [Frigoribacterium sp. ACAM 257]TWX40775.1 hypothetical protein ES689_04960 [Frigoribacterium sp. ACAM 257]